MKFSLIIAMLIFFQQHIFPQSKIEAFEKNKDAVVRIYNMQSPGAGTSYYYTTGSGFTINEDGWIFTNHHVIENSLGLYVVAFTDTDKPDTSAAYVIWEDEDLDIAILKANDLKNPPLKISGDDKINQGDEVIIMGFPGSNLNDHEIKVTSGILSSSTEDSTLMTTAPINPGNSGGPAINYNGEVVGQVYAKLVGVNVESTGFLRNSKYLIQAIEDAKEESISLERATGTDNYEVYKQMCFADAEYIKIHETEDSLKKMQHIDNAISMMSKVLETEPNYAKARYYLLNYIYKKAELHCEFDTDFDEEKADKMIEEFHYHWEKAKKDSRGEEYADRIDERIANQIYSYADKDDIACYRWRDRVARYSEYAIASYIRREEFQNYINYGATPEYLRETLINPTWERSKYKKYDALVNEIPLAITINNFISLGGLLGDSEIMSTVSNVEFEIEPFNDLKVLFSVGVVANQISGSSRDPLTDNIIIDYKDAETTPIKIGFYSYNVRARYNVTDVQDVLSRQWTLEYMTDMPGDGDGEIDSYTYFGLGGYNNEIFDTDYSVNFGHALELFDSRIWVDFQLLLGFGDIDDLYQIGLGLGYRY